MAAFVRPPKGIQRLAGEYALEGQEVVHRQKTFGELEGVYRDRAALAALDPQGVAYRVSNQNFHRQDAVLGNLQWGITYLNPFLVGEEYAMTHGHFHLDPWCDEYYYGLGGAGFLLFWDGGEDFYAEEVSPGSLHYISGRYAHRIINTGDRVLAVAACSLPATRQDHDVIRRRPFPYRCLCRDGAVVWEKEED